MIIDYLDNVFPEPVAAGNEDLLLTYLRNIDLASSSMFRGYMLDSVQQFALKKGNRSFKGATHIALPPPAADALDVPLRDVFARRESVRHYSADPMTVQELSTWLSAAVGDRPTARTGIRRRNYPSGGALYPVDVYLMVLKIDGLAGGLYHYDSAAHGLDLVDPVAAYPDAYFVDPQGMSGGAGSTWDNAAGGLVLTAYMNNSYVKYGDRAWKLMLLEAGHLAQNLALAAAATGRIALCPMGGMALPDLIRYMKLDGNAELPVYPLSFGPVRSS